jgi:hypothetical protein
MSAKKLARQVFNQAREAMRDGRARIELTVEDADALTSAFLSVLFEVEAMDHRPDWLKRMIEDK